MTIVVRGVDRAARGNRLLSCYNACQRRVLCLPSTAQTPMPTKPSIDAVAREAGVSIATVSRVLNGTKAVSAATRQRVESAVKALDYRANPFGRSLSTGESRIVLMLMPDFANPFYAEIVRGAAAVTRSAGYTLLPAGWEASSDVADRSLQMLAGSLSDGVINLMHMPDQKPWQEATHGKPWVNCSEFLAGDCEPYVSIDHRQAAMDAVQYLINKGHRRIGFVTTNDHFLYARQRREGYEAALTRAGIVPTPELIFAMGENSYGAGSQAAAAMLAVVDPPSAVFTVSDTLAIGAIKGFRKAGRVVPEDVAVMGFDDVPIADIFEPGLTTVAQPMSDLGATAAEMLLAILGGDTASPKILPHRLVVRQSA
ncbi:LacI family DNA-binding transcriptional regulator [Burkholderia gladioli]|uniref:LacI family DNA-binding transcriptional regulator n=1 Tax=Burkholderia gladioli TaxID=28095 RepID=UPI001FC8C78E|nr:LacI family DNA-binding transcriptional regulator [Burkholderia gladioli]